MRQTKLALLSLLLMIASVVRAYNVGDIIKVDNVAYRITKLSANISGTIVRGEVELAPGTTKTGAISIPSFVKDDYGTEYDVTSVGTSAFQNVAGITSITLPDGIVTINNGAFSLYIYTQD